MLHRLVARCLVCGLLKHASIVLLITTAAGFGSTPALIADGDEGFDAIPQAKSPDTTNPAERNLIIHADDVGLCRSVNQATIEALEAGLVRSVSIMVPCPAFEGFAEYASQHPEYDYGIHLTLNAEWPDYRWGTVLPPDKVSSLLDSEGYMWRSEKRVAANAVADDVERELRAQIELAKKRGIPLTHLDTHMGTLFMRPDLLEIYVRLGVDYDLPVLIPRDDSFLKQLGVGERVASQMADTIAALQKQGFPILETVRMHYRRDSVASKKRAYLKLIDSIPPGTSELIMHLGIENDELMSVMSNYRIRTGDHAVFTNKSFIARARRKNIRFITWAEFRQTGSASSTPQSK